MREIRYRICSKCGRSHLDVVNSELGSLCYKCWKKERKKISFHRKEKKSNDYGNNAIPYYDDDGMDNDWEYECGTGIWDGFDCFKDYTLSYDNGEYYTNLFIHDIDGVDKVKVWYSTINGAEWSSWNFMGWDNASVGDPPYYLISEGDIGVCSFIKYKVEFYDESDNLIWTWIEADNTDHPYQEP